MSKLPHLSGVGDLVLGKVILFGAGFAEQHRVDGLEVRRVGQQRQMHARAVGVRHVFGGTEVVLDVALALVVRGEVVTELVEQRLKRLAKDVACEGSEGDRRASTSE